jgi:hypothetical protein
MGHIWPSLFISIVNQAVKQKGCLFETNCLSLSIIKKNMKRIKEMVDSAISAKDARYMLTLWHSGGSISSAQFATGKAYILLNFGE